MAKRAEQVAGRAGDSTAPDRASAQQVIESVGARMRAAREALGLSIRDISVATGLSVSMVSLVERGKASPSVGTIVAISDALGISMAGLFAAGPPPASPVVRRSEQRVHTTADGMTRRMVVSEPSLGIEISEHEYEPRGESAPVATHHSGYECGLVVSGSLTVEVDGEEHLLRSGDAIRFPSSAPHRFVNSSQVRSRAVWFNIRTWPGTGQDGSASAEPGPITRR
jgi:transcriptional regulator with XRE-family HTH domain